MMVEDSPLDLADSSPAPPIPLRSPGHINHLRGFVGEDEDSMESHKFFGRPQIDVKSLTSPENFQEPEAAPPPSYEESDTSVGVDELGTPHSVTVRALSHPEAASEKPHVWHIKGTSITLSALDATVLVKADILTFRDLRLYDSTIHFDDQGPMDPVSGVISATLGTVGNICLRAADYPLVLSAVFHPPPGTTASQNAAEFVNDPEKGVTGIVGTGLKAPVDITYNMARGFHNFPKLYGDRTVRKLDPITGAKSGMKVAGKEFGLGCWDGVTGLITQPIKGARETGPVGAVKGFGKGVAGIACKPVSGAFGIPGYAGRGIYEQVQRGRKSKTNKKAREAQIKQGLIEWEFTTEEERRQILQNAKDQLEEFGKVLSAVKSL